MSWKRKFILNNHREVVQKKWAGFKQDNWEVLDEPVKRNREGQIYLSCKCLCGNRRYIRMYDLSGGNTKSCGCLHNKGGNMSGESIKLF